MKTGYKQLTADDRNTIQRGLNEGLSCRQIAQRLGRCPSTVTREMARSQAATEEGNKGGNKGQTTVSGIAKRGSPVSRLDRQF
jgi:IS30 family transposase